MTSTDYSIGIIDIVDYSKDILNYDKLNYHFPLNFILVGEGSFYSALEI